MRRTAVIVLAFVAAFAAPVRAACGAACVEWPAAPAAEPACHQPAHEAATPGTSPAAPDAGHCAHDHSISVRPAQKAGGDIFTTQPGSLAASFVPLAMLADLEAAARTLGISRGSPPLRFNAPLRI